MVAAAVEVDESSMKVLLKFGRSGLAARVCRHGWFRDSSHHSDGAIFLLRLLLSMDVGDLAQMMPKRFTHTTI